MPEKATPDGEEGAANLSRRKLKRIVHDPERSAAAIHLRYVRDEEPGIRRIRHGSAFRYEFEGKPLKDEPALARIRSLVLPPAWENVWICKDENGHLQATGLDTRGRKQYRYHPNWSALRSQTKFYQLYEFGLALPSIRACIDHDLARPGLPEAKVMAVAISIMQQTGIRIGSSAYERLYGSFGLSTLKDEHVRIKGSELRFSFRGKKGVFHELSLRSRRLARLVKQCRDIPGAELFQYFDNDGQCRHVDSGMINAYLKDISGGHFTAKDFRTWTGTLAALEAFREIGCSFSSATEGRRNINAALDAVAKQLGNTRTVCRKYYVHPGLLDLYESGKLAPYLKRCGDGQQGSGLSPTEEVLMCILKSSKPAG
jgi:DNA topoisomerase-1